MRTLLLLSRKEHPSSLLHTPSNLHRTPTSPTSLLNPEPKNQPIKIPHPNPLLIPPKPLDTPRRIRGTQPARGPSVSAAHTLIINDKFLINSPYLPLPRKTAKRGRRHGLNVLRERDSGGTSVSCLSDGGAEQEVAEAGQMGFFACFAGCGG
jgi:hypothetical protein